MREKIHVTSLFRDSLGWLVEFIAKVSSIATRCPEEDYNTEVETSATKRTSAELRVGLELKKLRDERNFVFNWSYY